MKVLHNPIRVAALVCVAVTSVFVMVMSKKLIDILSAPDWCARAINAEKLTTGRATSSVELCKELLLKQVGSLAMNSHIYAGTIALCLLVLIVIVIAGGKLSFQASKAGVSANVGKDVQQAAAIAATETAEAAEEKATEIREAVDFTIPPEDRP